MFELGYLVYYVATAVGLLLLFGLLGYLVHQFAGRHGPPWSKRSTGSKIAVCLAALAALWVASFPPGMYWRTRVAAVAGAYSADGVWGTATLQMEHDGTFLESWNFRNEYTGQADERGSVRGEWKDLGRDWASRRVRLQGFRPLAQWERGSSFTTHSVLLGPYAGSTTLEVDAGADIIFRKLPGER